MWNKRHCMYRNKSRGVKRNTLKTPGLALVVDSWGETAVVSAAVMN